MNEHYPFVNPPLPYPYDAMEPYIDQTTMEVHHNRYLQSYVDNLNQLLKEYPAYQELSLEQLVLYAECMPAHIRMPVRNYAGGVYNHLFYFSTLKQPDHDNRRPGSLLLSMLKWQFNSLENFQKLFTSAALSVFGSGYAWLVQDAENKFAILTTANQDTPLFFNVHPLLAIDVWEHAYYLKHYNLRADYIRDWFSVVDWEQVSRNYTP